MYLKQWLFIALGLLVISINANETDRPYGQELLLPFKQNLKQALKQGLSKGAVNAITVCQIDAPKIVDELSTAGIQLGRSSARLRNPANTPPAWVVPYLSIYQQDKNDRAPRELSLRDDRIGYIEPITVQPLCLTCHGESLAPDVASKLDELYPKDQARNYQVGDFRGVFWVEYPR